MSWLDKIKTALVIQTGDGKQYKPQWINATKKVDYNVAEFEFPNITGTLVKRGTPKGARYNLELFFQGENNLDDARKFETSAADPRPWNITHPLYGRLTVQPLSLEFDNTAHNISKITGAVVETISDEYPKATSNPKDKIVNDSETCNETAADAYVYNSKPKAQDITAQKSYNELAYKNAAKFCPQDMGDELFNLYNTATGALTNLNTEAKTAISAMQKVIKFPAYFTTGVAERLGVLTSTFNSLRDGLPAVPTKSQKSAYEVNNGTGITAMLVTAGTPATGDYTNRTDVLNTAEMLLQYYNLFIADLDNLQTATGGAPDSYLPNADSLQQLALLFNYTLSNLFTIAANAKQERSIVLTQDSNWILLAHKFYGLKADDSTITDLMKQNNAGLNSVLQVKANTRVYYYV